MGFRVRCSWSGVKELRLRVWWLGFEMWIGCVRYQFAVEVLGCRVMATQGDLTHNRQFESGRAQACLASEVERRGKGGLSER